MNEQNELFNFEYKETEFNVIKFKELLKTIPDTTLEEIIKYLKFLKYNQVLNCINKLNASNIDNTQWAINIIHWLLLLFTTWIKTNKTNPLTWKINWE